MSDDLGGSNPMKRAPPPPKPRAGPPPPPPPGSRDSVPSDAATVNPMAAQAPRPPPPAPSPTNSSFVVVGEEDLQDSPPPVGSIKSAPKPPVPPPTPSNPPPTAPPTNSLSNVRLSEEDSYDAVYKNNADSNTTTAHISTASDNSNKTWSYYEKGHDEAPMVGDDLFIGPGRDEDYRRIHNSQPVGLIDRVKEFSETPADALRRILMPQERVVADFDCYYPYKAIPLWKIIVYSVLSLGLFLLIVVYRQLQRYCVEKELCTPTIVEYARGKVAITNFGRLILWSVDVLQEKDEQSYVSWLFSLCCPTVWGVPINYSIHSHTRVYAAKQIREITQYIHTSSQCFETFNSGIKVSIGKFDTSHQAQSSCMQTVAIGSYIQTIRSYISATFEKSVERTEAAFGVASNRVFHIISTKYDQMHHVKSSGAAGAVGAAILEQKRANIADDLAHIFQKLIRALPPIDDAFFRNDANEADRNFAVSENIAETTIVDDQGLVTIPKVWLSLVDEEEVLAVTGQLVQMTFTDWVLSFSTFGLYYLFFFQYKKFSRSAMILTNKRLLCVDVYHPLHKIPSDWKNVSIQVRWLISGNVKSGFMNVSGEEMIEVGLETEGGGLMFTLFHTARSFPFAKSLQMSTLRRHTRYDISKRDRMSHELPMSIARALPLVPNDETVDVVKGNMVFQPFCHTQSYPQKLACGVVGYIFGDFPLVSERMCSRFCFPWPIHFLTCGLRPFLGLDTLIVTDNSLLSVVSKMNFGLCTFKLGKGEPTSLGFFATRDYFVITWVPLERILGHALDIETEGDENCFRTCCAQSPLCSKFFPMNNNAYQLVVDVKDFEFLVNGRKKNQNFHMDTNLRHFTDTLDMVERAVANDELKISWKKVKK